MKVNSRIELEFAGITLPIGKDAEGRDIVPVKPISDVHGLEWSRQHKKLQTPYLTRRLGVCVVPMYYAGQLREMVCIRLDRVSAFLNQIEPERVRGGGNETGADFLEAKQCEWDDLLHEYETRQGGMLAAAKHERETRQDSFRCAATIARIDGMKNPILQRIALAEIGIDQNCLSANASQPDLFKTI